MREAPIVLVVAIALGGILGGCLAPLQAEGESVAPAAIDDDASSPPPPPPPPPAQSAQHLNVCAHDPCSTRVAEGFYAEPAVAFAPHDPAKVLVASFGSDGSHTGSWAYASLTTDGGATWTTTRAPDAPALIPAALPQGQLTIVADTTAAWPEPDTLVIIALLGETLHTPDWQYVRAISVIQWRSTDGGATWSQGTVLARAEGLTGGILGNQLHARWFDKPALAHDAATGNMHLFFQRIVGSPAVFMMDILHMRSDDAGATWTEPTAVPAMANLYGVTAVAHDGIVLASAVNPGYRLFRSEDAAATWNEVAELSDTRPGSGTWQSAPLALWVDAAGGMHALAARSEGDENERLLLHASHDGGKTWSNGTSLLPETATERRNPVMAVDPTTGRGFVASHQGDGSAETLATWAIPLDAGIPGAPVRLDATASTRGILEYNGAAARGSTGAIAYPSADDEGAPLYVAMLRGAG